MGKAAAERRVRRGALVGGKMERNHMAVSLAPGQGLPLTPQLVPRSNQGSLLEPGGGQGSSRNKCSIPLHSVLTRFKDLTKYGFLKPKLTSLIPLFKSEMREASLACCTLSDTEMKTRANDYI